MAKLKSTKKKRDYKKERRDYYGYGKAAAQTPRQRMRRKEKSARNRARAAVQSVSKNRSNNGDHPPRKKGHV